ncbi:MAG: GDP-mannose 4,6-dehydratase [Pseudomonadota bacterium]
MGKLLITGGSGFTGRHLIETAMRQGYECVCLSHTADDTVETDVATVIADLLDSDSLADAVATARPDFVVHLAAQANVASGDLATTYQTNLVGTVNLLETLREADNPVQRVVLASTANLYGRVKQLPISEATSAQPTNHYSVSKWAMELAAGLFDSMSIVITRPFNYTGVGQSTDFVVPKIVSAYAQNSDELTLGNIDVARDFSDVRDIAMDYLTLLQGNPPPVVNLCSGRATSIRQLIETLESISGHRLIIRSSNELRRSGDIDTLYGQPNAFVLESGRDQRIPLESTLTWMLGAGNEPPS